MTGPPTVTPNQPPVPAPEASATKKLSLSKRILRSIPVLAILLLLTWVFGHSGILHRVEIAVTNAQMRLNKVTEDSPVAIVNINDSDYHKIFHDSSPLDPQKLAELIADIARGEPAVIAIDIDTSAPQFQSFVFSDWRPQLVWERELHDLPQTASGSEKPAPLAILGGRKNVDQSKNSIGIPVLIDDSEYKVTRRYRRVIATQDGPLPSFPWAIATAYLKGRPDQLAKIPETTDALMIRFSGDADGSHRIAFTAQKLHELSTNWPAASPIAGKIVLLGGSYLGQDRHDTPIGQMHGVDIMANVVETELNGGGYIAPSNRTLFLLEVFEAFGLILLFHILSFRSALAWSLLLIPVVALTCSKLAYGNLNQFTHFIFVLIGLLIFELYEHFRRSAVLQIFREIRGSSSNH